VNSGEVDVPADQWDGTVAAATHAGLPVYASTVQGKVTMTAPTASGSYRTRVGYVTGALKVAVSIGDPVYIP
jgi:hypothetical protein